MERHAVPFPYLFTYVYYSIKFLVRAGEERGGKAIETHPLRGLGGLFKSQGVTDITSPAALADDRLQEIVQGIVVDVFYIKVPYLLEPLKGFEPARILRIRMDVGVEPKAPYLYTFAEVIFEGVDAAVRTADVHEEFHGTKLFCF